MLKNVFWTKNVYFYPNLRTLNKCTHLHHSALDSAGQKYLEMTKIFSAYAKTTCVWNSSRLVFAGEVKRHNVCKRHGFLDIGFKQTRPSPFSPRHPNGIKNWTAFKRKFEEIVPKLSVKPGNRNSQDSQ